MLIWIGRLVFFYIFWRSIRHPGWAILRCHIDIYVPWTVRLWNFLPEECFPLTYDLKSLNSNCMYGVNLIKIITVKPILDHAYVCMDPLQLIQEKKTRQKYCCNLSILSTVPQIWNKHQENPIKLFSTMGVYVRHTTIHASHQRHIYTSTRLAISQPRTHENFAF